MRYRLRTLLIVMLVAGLAVGTVAEMRRMWNRRIDEWRRAQLARLQAVSAAARSEPTERERDIAWDRAKAKSTELGAPQPARVP